MSKIARVLVVDLDDPSWFIEYQLGQLLIMGFEKLLIVDESFCFPYVRKRQAAIDLLWHWWGSGIGQRHYATEDAVRWSMVQCRWKPIAWALERVGVEY